MSLILTLNVGSSSIKFAVFDTGSALALLASGQVELDGADRATLTLTHAGQKSRRNLPHADQAAIVAAILSALDPVLEGHEVSGVGHRIVHGGLQFDSPEILTTGVLADLEDLVPMAPLHQPYNLAAVRAAMAAFPNAVQVGCFDTAFHRNHPWTSDAFALPRRFFDDGVRRYGFHGLSYDYIADELTRLNPEYSGGRCVVAHLGNGASMCALDRGRSVDCTMGFSVLDGLPMGTRSGRIDPGVLLFLMQQKGMTADALADILYHESGLKGLSDLSSDMRTLEAASTPEATHAIDYLTRQIRREIGAMAADMGGLDTVVFCGGIGENSAAVRAGACARMEWLGIALDPVLNAEAHGVISTGSVAVRVIRTNEEIVIARAVCARIS